MGPITEPAWLLLLWAAVAATLAAALLGAPPGATTVLVRTREYRRRRVRGAIRSVVLSALMGMLLYPLVYGVLFESVGRADLPLGAGIGAVHGLLGLLVRGLRRLPGPHAAPIFQLLLARLAYGSILGFLYVVPPTLP